MIVLQQKTIQKLHNDDEGSPFPGSSLPTRLWRAKRPNQGQPSDIVARGKILGLRFVSNQKSGFEIFAGGRNERNEASQGYKQGETTPPITGIPS